MIMITSGTWTEVKNFVDNRPQVKLQYIDVNNIYHLVAYDGFFALKCIINKVSPRSTEQADFEDNYKSSANQDLGVFQFTSPAGRLKVESEFSNTQSQTPIGWSSKIRYDDMNSSNGGVARNTLIGTGSFTQLYSYTGSGSLVGFLVALEKFEKEGYYIRLVVDDEEIFGSSGISTLDIVNKDLYMWEKDSFDHQGQPFILGFHVAERGIRWQGPMGKPIIFDSNVKIYAKKQSGDPKKFQAGLVNIVKDS